MQQVGSKGLHLTQQPIALDTLHTGCDYGEWIQKNMTRDIMVHVLPSSVFAMSLQQENTTLATSGNVNGLPQKHSGILKTNLVESGGIWWNLSWSSPPLTTAKDHHPFTCACTFETCITLYVYTCTHSQTHLSPSPNIKNYMYRALTSPTA